jgi:hypothetical protein
MERRVTALPPNGLHAHISNRFLPTGSVQDMLNFRVPSFASIPNDTKTLRGFVHNVVFRNFIPTIRAGINDHFNFTVNNTIYDATFSPGVYSIITLAESLETELQSADPGFTVTYDDDQKLLNIVVPFGVTFTINYETKINNYFNIQQVDAGYRFLEMCGLLRNTNIPYGAGTVVGAEPYNLITADFMKINLDNLNLNVMNTNPRNPQTIATLFLDTDYGQFITYETMFPNAFEMSPHDIENLYISCTDQYGDRITGLPATATLEIHIILFPIE